MRLLRPRTPNPDLGVLGRMGRVVHWGALLVVAAILCLIAYAWLSPADAAPRNVGTALFAILAAVVLLVGRAIRFVLASE
jgi:hypothetical protein